MKKCVNGKIVDITDEEIAIMKDELAKHEAEEAHRPLLFEEVADIFIKAQINSIEINDQTSVRMKSYYPAFEDIIGQTIDKIGFKFTYNGFLYKTVQANLTIQEHYPPGVGTESLYTKIDETHLGNKYDPIPYDGNMVLENGKYYTQNDVTYLCTRDTLNAVYNDLAELVGVYVEISE